VHCLIELNFSLEAAKRLKC